MNLEPVIQGEVSQKEKKKQYTYWCIYMEPRKMVLMNLLQGRNRGTDREQACGPAREGKCKMNGENSI